VPSHERREPEPPHDLGRLVSECLDQPIGALHRLAGGLSPRQFFRVNGARQPVIAMWLPEDAPERALARRLGRQLPFLEIRELLAAAGVRVPHLYGARPDLGLLVVEDLGETLAERLTRCPDERDALYRTAVHELARAQLALRDLPPDSIIRTRSFDRELLSAELDHFREWGVEALGVSLTESERTAFERAKVFLVESIVRLPRGFVHRDYQSRNLLPLSDGRIAWIDFQDALLGPRAYDLVALLCDSYQSFERSFVTDRLDDFARSRGLTSERAELEREFDLITVQRKLKDAGRFVFFERTRGDPSYLPYFVPSLLRAAEALSRLPKTPELSPLAELTHRQIEMGRSRGMLRS